MTALFSLGQLYCNSTKKTGAAFWYDILFSHNCILYISILLFVNSTPMNKAGSYSYHNRLLMTPHSVRALALHLILLLITDYIIYMVSLDCIFFYFHFCWSFHYNTEMKSQAIAFQKAIFYLAERGLDSHLGIFSVILVLNASIVYSQSAEMPHQ